MLFLVACVYEGGVYAESFRVVEAASRLAVTQHIVDSPDIWNKFLHDARLYDPIIRGNRPYYADPCPVGAEEALRLIDRSSVDGDSRARMSIHPITEILRLPVSEPRTLPAEMAAAKEEARKNAQAADKGKMTQNA